MRLGFFGLVCSIGLVFATGCSGKVVVDSGVGGAGNGSSTGNSMTTTGSGDPKTLCDAFCAMNASIGCDPQGPECSAICPEIFAQIAPCDDEFAAVLQCMVDNSGQVTDCQPPVVCNALQNKFEACLGSNTCGDTGECAISSDGSCTCKSQCNGSTFSAECDGGSGVCVCFQDGIEVGKCQEPMPSCDMFTGCCGDFFVIPG